MRTIKILFILVFFSLHAGATGYVHNMFVAHKKLQAGKEVVIGVAAKKAVVSMKQKPAHAKQASVFHAKMTKQMSDKVTLNERVLEEGPGSVSFFSNDKNEDSDETMISKLVNVVKCVIYAFVGTPQLGN